MIFDISQFDGFHDAKIPNLKDFATQKFPISRGQDLFPNRWKKTLVQTNILVKFHHYWTKTLAYGVFTRFC